MIASKMNDDGHYRNSVFAGVVGYSVIDINALEIQACSMLQFRLVLPYEQFSAFWTAIVSSHAIHSLSRLDIHHTLLTTSLASLQYPMLSWPAYPPAYPPPVITPTHPGSQHAAWEPVVPLLPSHMYAILDIDPSALANPWQ